MNVNQYVDDLEIALALMSNIQDLFNKLEEKQKTMVLQIIVKQIVIDVLGNISFLKLHSPFTYLSILAASLGPFKKECDSSFYILHSRKLSIGNDGISFDIFYFDDKMKLKELTL